MGLSVGPLGRLKRVDARTVWTSEAQHFTPWVKANIETLSDALGMELELPEIEVPVGNFACDVVAQEVGNEHKVIIENQLEPTDHGHLGQLLTYAAGLDARAIVWISPQFRPEHRQAIDWLNANTAEGLAFFGVEVELLQIADSPYAPHFKVVALPNDWQKAVKVKAETQPSQKALIYQQFYADLLARYNQSFPHQRTAKKTSPQHWLTIAGAGRSGFSYAVSFTRDARMRVELAIGVGSGLVNKAAFDQLMAQRGPIESEIGEELSWERLDNAKMSRIAIYRQGEVTDGEPLRTQHIGWGVAMVDKFRQVFGERIKKVRLDETILLPETSGEASEERTFSD
jgi:hypothetical protein